ncbi:MAG: hypothetical protein V1876_04195 [Candidatus Peregrinibacteria bacterium]
MAPTGREDRSFVGCGDEEYPKSGTTSLTAPVGPGIHGEVLPPQVALRLQYGELMYGEPGAGGEEYVRGEVETSVNPVEPQAIPAQSDVDERVSQMSFPDEQVRWAVWNLYIDARTIMDNPQAKNRPAFDDFDNEAVRRWRCGRRKGRS